MHEIILCKLGEVVLKGLNRRSFEMKLMSNIRRRTQRYGKFKIYSRQSTIYVEPVEETCDLNAAYDACKKVFGIIAIAVMAPLVEELLFRGAIEGHFLQTGKRPGMAILLSALIFGLIHVNPAQVPFAFCLGLVFGWLYYRTGSIIPGMIGHFLNNSLATIAMATSTQEELNEKTVDMIGATPTYILLAAAIIILVGMYFYLNKHLPQPGTSSEVTNTQA